MNTKEFEKIVAEAVNALPGKAKASLENLVFVVEEEARKKNFGETEIFVDDDILGLYEGVPKSARGSGYFGVMPDKITIFQKPIEELAGRTDSKKIRKLVFEVVWHEVGHHLGFGEREISELEEKKFGDEF
ncbi:MAG: metallopeptidase family protein [Candidatus Pacebacteria bacterium]|nr:metallopeptidase family protein [Candidatus Paceibacterota bacterium]